MKITRIAELEIWCRDLQNILQYRTPENITLRLEITGPEMVDILKQCGEYLGLPEYQQAEIMGAGWMRYQTQAGIGVIIERIDKKAHPAKHY